MKRVGIPLSNGKLSENFGKCVNYQLFDIKDDFVENTTIEMPVFKNIDELPVWIAKLKITDIIVGNISRKMINEFHSKTINILSP